MLDQQHDPTTKPYTPDGMMVAQATRHARDAQSLPQSAPEKLAPRAYGKVVGDVIQGADRVSNISQLGVIATAAAGVGAVSGYGLVLGLSVKQAADIVADVRASAKSINHASNLQRIQHQAKLPPKWCGDRANHDAVAYQVLPLLDFVILLISTEVDDIFSTYLQFRQTTTVIAESVINFPMPLQ